MDRMQGYRARKQTHIHKLAMVLSAAESSELVITKDHLATALAFTAGIERDMHIVFESIGVHQSARDAEILMSYVRANKIVPHQELWRVCMRAMSLKEFSEAIDSLVRAGYIKLVQEGSIIQVHSTGEEEASHSLN